MKGRFRKGKKASHKQNKGEKISAKQLILSNRYIKAYPKRWIENIYKIHGKEYITLI